MKIVFDLRVLSSDWSGIASYTKNLIRSLGSGLREHEAVALVAENFSESELSGIIGRDIKDLFADLITFPFGIYDVRGFISLRKLLLKQKTDLYFTPQYFWPYFLLGSVKVAAIIHDIIPLTHSSLLKKSKKVKLRFLFSICTWLTVRFSAILFVNSGTTRKEILSYYGERYDKKITILYPSLFGLGDSPSLRQLPAKDNYLIYVGRQDPYKNLLKLTEAFSVLVDKGFSGELLIVGKVDKRYQDLEEKIITLNLKNRVRFTGFVSEDELKDLYRQARLSVQPSLAEGFGLTAFEPVLNSCLTVVSDIPVMRETLGEEGIYFNPDSIEDMARVIDETLSIGKDKYIEKLLSIKNLLKVYSPDKQAEVFRETVNGFLSPETD